MLIYYLLNLKKGTPILIPNFLAKELLAITQPSLLDNTTTGFSLRWGLKISSQEA